MPRFDYEAHFGALTSPTPHWPQSTRAVSQLRVSLRVRPSGMLAGLTGPRIVHLDITDYPGEWLLDLGLLDKTYAQWSAEVLDHVAGRPQAAEFLARAGAADAQARFEEPDAKALADRYTAYLHSARDAGFYGCTPGRFLLAGDLAGSPVLTFAPLPPVNAAPRRSLWREMERRFEAYKTKVVKPFFRNHFAKIDRQIVLVDVLDAVHKGPQAVADMRHAMGDILAAFRPGRNGFLTRLLGSRRVDKILFAATKADHLHHTQHDRLAAIMTALTREAKERARFAGAGTHAMAIAALRTTVEETMTHQGRVLECVRGLVLETGKQAAFYAGELPDDPQALLASADDPASARHWPRIDATAYAPAELMLKPEDGPPHIRLDQAAQFLIGDRL